MLMLGSTPSWRRSAVIEFLSSALMPATQRRYKEAVAAFSAELDLRGVQFELLDAERQDWVLAEYCVEAFEAGWPRSRVTMLVAGLQKTWPSRVFKTSWKVLE
eukprot:7934578-Lingulodinium_polyedra.AAC.1